jgi:GNAT superfamily N-acetyltransferase
MGTGLDLSVARQGALAAVLEEQQRRFAAIRYGSRLRVGIARAVLNPDAPLAMCNFAATLQGSPEAAAVTLAELPAVWDEAGLHQVFVLDSPSSLPELGIVAEECEYDAVEESSVLVLTDPRQLMDGEPGVLARPLTEQQENDLTGVLSDAFGYSKQVEQRLAQLYGQRLDDPRVLAMGAERDGQLVGVATAFVESRLGLVADVGVLPEHRGHRFGRALASAVTAECLRRGAEVIWLVAEAGGRVETFWTRLGFEPAYDAVTYQLRI